MNIARIAFRMRPLVYLILAILMGFGAWSYFELPAREDPKITVREAVVRVCYPGLSPERMERLVTRTIEEAVRQVEEIEEIRSVTMAGRSIVHVEVDDSYFALDRIWDDVADKVDRAAAELPDGASAPVVDTDVGDVAVITAALTADGFSMAEMADMAEHVRDMMYAVPGTARVDIVAAQPERIFVETSDARLAELGVSPEAVVGAIAEENIIRPGGEIDVDGRTFAIEPTGDFESLEDIRETLVRLPSGDLLPLRDIATVTRGTRDPPARKAYFDGAPAIILAIAMLDGESVLDFSARAEARLEEVAATLPVGYDLEIVTRQADQVERAVYGVSASVLQTLLIVSAVVVLLLGLRTGLIVGAIVPSVMLITLAVMGIIGLPLERMSLATLVIALGLLVDAGVVVAEDFKTRIEAGESRDAALDGVGRTLSLPLLVSTATTILAFLPLMLADHVSGEYARAISLVILISLSASWVVAMTVTPLLAHRFIRAERNDDGTPKRGLFERAFEPVSRIYERLLRAILRRRWLFLAAMGAALAAGVAGVATAPQKFFPDSDRSQVLVYVDLPAGASARRTDAEIRSIVEALVEPGRFPAIEGAVGYVGFGGPRFVLSLTPIDPAPNKGFVLVDVRDFESVAPTIETLRAVLGAEFPDVSARVASMFLGPTDSSVIEVQVKGPDADFIVETAARVEELLLENVPGVIDVRDDWENRVSRLVVAVDQDRARRASVTSADVARIMNAYFSGATVSQFREGDDTVPIVARASGEERSELGRVRSLTVYDADGNPVPLSQVADVALETGFFRIAREGMMRTVTVSARHPELSAEEMVPLIAPALSDLRADLPLNHAIEFDGVVAQSAEGRAALLANMPLCLAIMFVLVVAQFNGFVRPAIIFGTIPLLVVGVAAGLHVLSADFGFMPILGILALMGIIINNAIVLIDRIDIERAAGEADDVEALVAACRRRLRPIVMTTVTTVLGLMPLIVGEDALFYGLAAVMAFGLAVGTVLTLGVVPVLYSLAFGIRPAPATAADRNASPANLRATVSTPR